MPERACTAHPQDPYEAEVLRVSINGKWVRILLRCPVCDRPRGERMDRTADRPDLAEHYDIVPVRPT